MISYTVFQTSLLGRVAVNHGSESREALLLSSTVSAGSAFDGVYIMENKLTPKPTRCPLRSVAHVGRMLTTTERGLPAVAPSSFHTVRGPCVSRVPMSIGSTE